MNDFQSVDYTFEDLLVVKNSYNRSPLFSLILFEIEHEIPVLGLLPDTENHVVIIGESENSEEIQTILTMITDPVLEGLLDFKHEVSQPDKMPKGLTFVSPSRDSYPAAVDSNGDVRWYSSMMTSHKLKRLEESNENIII